MYFKAFSRTIYTKSSGKSTNVPSIPTIKNYKSIFTNYTINQMLISHGSRLSKTRTTDKKHKIITADINSNMMDCINLMSSNSINSIIITEKPSMTSVEN